MTENRSTAPNGFRPNRESFDKLYRGEPAFEGAPAPDTVPWDIGQAQPRLRELEALGAISGEVLDIGCGLGDNAIYLAGRGHSVTALDGSPTAIERARQRAADAGVKVTFGVADATDLTGYESRFDTVIDSALFHCLEEDDRRAYAAALHRSARSGARLFLYCFSDGNVNGLTAPGGAVTEDDIRDTLKRANWRVDFLGPTTYLGNTAGFAGVTGDLPEALLAAVPPERVEQMREMGERMSAILPLLDGDRVHLPFTVVHATRIG